MNSDKPKSSSRRSFFFSLLIFSVFLYAWFSINEVQFEALREIGRSAVVTILYQSTEKLSVQNSTLNSPTDMRILFAVLTLPDQPHRRHLLRMIYGTQSTPGAQIDVKFVFCNLTKEDQKIFVALEIMRYDDIIILNCTENMNTGKTLTFFSSLPEMFNDTEGPNRPYDYVMKADDDVFFRLEKLVESLRPLPKEDLYYGYVIPCTSMDPFKHYMSGMGYLVSWDIVEWISTSEFAKNNTVGPEDLVFGKWMREGQRGKNRYNAKWSMYNFPVPPSVCTHDLWPDTIAVHLLKTPEKWVKTLQYFNFTNDLKPSKLYHIH